jgi:hypothetical protein
LVDLKVDVQPPTPQYSFFLPKLSPQGSHIIAHPEISGAKDDQFLFQWGVLVNHLPETHVILINETIDRSSRISEQVQTN